VRPQDREVAVERSGGIVRHAMRDVRHDVRSSGPPPQAVQVLCLGRQRMRGEEPAERVSVAIAESSRRDSRPPGGKAGRRPRWSGFNSETRRCNYAARASVGRDARASLDRQSGMPDPTVDGRFSLVRAARNNRTAPKYRS
jgi:hypothetical protein